MGGTMLVINNGNHVACLWIGGLLIRNSCGNLSPVFLCVHNHVIDVSQGIIYRVLKLFKVHFPCKKSVVGASLCCQHLDVGEMLLHEVTHDHPELWNADQEICSLLVNVVMDSLRNFQDFFVLFFHDPDEHGPWSLCS